MSRSLTNKSLMLKNNKGTTSSYETINIWYKNCTKQKSWTLTKAKKG